jgi:hypothetical protein
MNWTFKRLPGMEEHEHLLPRIERMLEEWAEDGRDQLLVGELDTEHLFLVMIGNARGLQPVLELFHLEPKKPEEGH